MGSSLHLLAFMHLIFLLFMLHCIVAYNSSSTHVQCYADECSALMQFKENLIIDSYANYSKVASWKNGNCCSWEGVQCDEATGHVIGLDLSNSWLYGSINTNSSLFYLVHLRRLNLANNDFNQSKIPLEIRYLSKLRYFNLSFSNFFGEIPVEILELSKLEFIDFSTNPLLKMKSKIFNSIVEKLTNLKQLYLDGVNISSMIPQSMTSLSSLTSLSLEDCGLYGEFPIGIFNLPNLQLLWVPHNPFLTGHLPEFNVSSRLEILKLRNTSFSGQLPDSIDNLKFLSYLDLWLCSFSGSIPSSLTNLTQLAILSLSQNNFRNWTLFPSLGKLTNLAILGLAKTNLYGEIPSSLQNLTQLTELYLYRNHLTAQFPYWLGNLTKLTVLSLNYNNLHGPIPRSISGLMNLQYFEASDNSLGGTLEFDMFLKLRFLVDVQLTANNLSVITKSDINGSGTIPKFGILGLGSCNLSEFPIFLQCQDELEFLELSRNKIHGKIPEWMWNVGSETLWHLNLKSNFLTGFDQPKSILPWRSLCVLQLDFNEFQGPIPIPTSSIVYYSISNNKFSGKMSSIICTLTSLSVFDLSNNNLSGILLPCLGNFSDSLSILNLRNNSIHGNIPPTYTKQCKLRMIDFSKNQLKGKVPKSLANCTMLETLNLGDNQINDTFPNWLGTLPELRVLILRSNRFYGTIGKPKTNFDFPKLHIIDLSFNRFIGKLPSQHFKIWISMRFADAKGLSYLHSNTSLHVFENSWSHSYDYSMSMTNKGTMTEYDHILEFLAVIDLSSNRFEGDIPQAIGNLKALVLLNISNNSLTGHIPPILGNIAELEALDLSQNKLSGEIPQQLVQLTFLAFLNVSHNYLTGPIPQGKQFNTFENNSFEGNSGLCGKPLSKECVLASHPTPENEEGQSSAISFGWKIVVIGYACGVVVGSLIGHIVTRRKPQWFIRLMINSSKKR